ncbi:crotonobetainyl-CoA hydratase [Neobacillus niacini]|uniref:enoyl-CoA hydratase-related protein n=1 Tax=Neobacillus niacini TaxID=86668 RepID=UPI00277DB269|nr:enoyl-CoA hydratase-related protein [Neobacillus niacini]MDQ1002231.1 crotonobetainyl-CoA hydratase [Neobacillus niacini]
MDFETILFEKRGQIALITLNRPEVMNAVNRRLSVEVGFALEEFNNDPDLRVAIITGAGEKAFCVGSDLKEKLEIGLSIPDEIKEWTEKLKEWGFAGITKRHISKPIIAAVNGYALGGGFEIALSCDLIVASEKASFGLPEVKHGLIAGAGGLLRLPRNIPVKVAMRAILTGKSLSAEEAKSWGIVNEIVPHDDVLSAAIRLAEDIIKNSPTAVSFSKEVVYRGLDSTLTFPPDGWKINDDYISQAFDSDDAKEGIRSFVEKREPNWGRNNNQ